MTRPFDPEIDLEAFLDWMEEGDFTGRRSGIDSRRRVEQYMEAKRLDEALRDFNFDWEALDSSPYRTRRLI